MSSVTLVESAKLAQDDLLAGVIETVITVNYMFQLLPFLGIDGNSLAYNRENALGDTQALNVGGSITAKNPATFTKVNADLTTLIGDAEVNGLIQATRSAVTDQEATQVASKAKSLGRQYQDQLVSGDGSSNTFEGLLVLNASGQEIDTGTDGSNLSFAILDELLDAVVDKDGEVDAFAMHARTIRAYKALVRALGGTSADDVYQLPSGKRIPAYSGVPIFRNDWIPTDQTQGASSDTTSVMAFNMDDGSQKIGFSGITASNAAGIQVEDVGIHQSKDETITRVKWYAGLALFNEKGLAVAPGIKN